MLPFLFLLQGCGAGDTRMAPQGAPETEEPAYLVLAGGFPATCCDEFRADFQRDGDVDLDDCVAIEDWQLRGGPGCGGS